MFSFWFSLLNISHKGDRRFENLPHGSTGCLLKDMVAQLRLSMACESAKRKLSQWNQTRVNVEAKEASGCFVLCRGIGG